MWQLILFRGLQGLGGGAVFPVALAVVADLYTPAERGKYLGLLRGRVRALVAARAGRSAGSSPTSSAGTGSSSSTSRSALVVARHPVAPAAGDQAPGCRRATSTTWARRCSPRRSAPFLIGLTNKQTGDWTDPAVGGLIARRARPARRVFLWIESRVADPIVPLGLFRIRAFTVSVVAMFLAAFGFFGAVIFLPRWFQAVDRRQRHRVRLQHPAAAGRR